MYKRKIIQHKILGHLIKSIDDNIKELMETIGSKKDWVKLKDLCDLVNEDKDTVFKNVFELYNKGYITVQRPDEFEYKITDKGEAAYYAEDLLRERRDDINKLWLTVAQYLFYAVAIISSICAIIFGTININKPPCP